jgi:hypothetical protein
MDVRPSTTTRDEAGGPHGVPAEQLTDEDLVRELEQLHRTRADTLRHATDSALATHEARSAELEAEYVRRWPDREVDPARTRAGRRMDDAQPSTASPQSEETR